MLLLYYVRSEWPADHDIRQECYLRMAFGNQRLAAWSLPGHKAEIGNVSGENTSIIRSKRECKLDVPPVVISSIKPLTATVVVLRSTWICLILHVRPPSRIIYPSPAVSAFAALINDVPGDILRNMSKCKTNLDPRTLYAWLYNTSHLTRAIKPPV